MDSTYSWIVAVASGVVFLLVSLPIRVGSQLFVSMLDHFGSNRRDTSFPFALASLMRSLSGPLAGFFGEKLGLQTVTLTGCVLCAVGVGGCFFAENLIAYDICFGIIYGIGFGWSTCSVPEILNQYFDKHKAKANGIYFGGSGLGAFLAPPLIEIILNTYGLSGTILIVCAILLNSIPAAMLLRKPDRSPTTSFNVLTKTYHPRTCQVFSKLNHSAVIDEKKTKPEFEDHLDGVVQLSGKLSSEYSSKCTSKDIAETYKDGKLFSTFFNKIVDPFLILGSPVFLLVAFTLGVHSFLNYLFWTITVDIVREKNIEQYLEVYFVLGNALFDTIGRFFLCFIADSGFISVPNFSALLMAAMGLICMFLTWVSRFLPTMFFICFLGLVFGGNSSLQPVLITVLIQKEKRPMAMASRLILYVPMSFAMSPLIGYFKGVRGSYDGLMYCMTFSCVICVIILIFLPRLAGNRNNENL